MELMTYRWREKSRASPAFSPGSRGDQLDNTKLQASPVMRAKWLVLLANPRWRTAAHRRSRRGMIVLKPMLAGETKMRWWCCKQPEETEQLHRTSIEAAIEAWQNEGDRPRQGNGSEGRWWCCSFNQRSEKKGDGDWSRGGERWRQSHREGLISRPAPTEKREVIGDDEKKKNKEKKAMHRDEKGAKICSQFGQGSLKCITKILLKENWKLNLEKIYTTNSYLIIHHKRQTW